VGNGKIHGCSVGAGLSTADDLRDQRAASICCSVGAHDFISTPVKLIVIKGNCCQPISPLAVTTAPSA
jgi:hypothetical protein